MTKELQEKYEAREKAQSTLLGVGKCGYRAAGNSHTMPLPVEEFQSQNDELAAHVRSLELELQAMRNKIKGLKQVCCPQACMVLQLLNRADSHRVYRL